MTPQFVFAVLFLTLSSTCFGADAPSLISPNISANVLLLGRQSNFHKEDSDPTNIDQNRNGFNIQEAELQFYSDVDPYTKLNLVLSVHSEYEANGTDISEKWIVEPEEAFAESNVIPAVTLKLGKIKAAMGKHNQLHTHAFPLVEAPLPNKFLLGDEGLNDVGLSAAVFLPAPWFSELSLQALRGEGENAEFKSPTPGDSVSLAHWKNLFDLTDSWTFEAGASYAQGMNSYRKNTTLTGADLTFKWRPVDGGRYHSLIWGSEYLARTQGQASVSDEKGSGLISFLQYQFAERWIVIYRFDNLTVKNTFDAVALPNDTWERHSLGFAYKPSEFSIFKLEYDQRRGGTVNANGDTTEKAIFVQANFTIGAHPAHSY